MSLLLAGWIFSFPLFRSLRGLPWPLKTCWANRPASRADRVSFGCSEENDFTYFGRALFAEALNETDDLARAFELAKTRVAEREQADDFEPSEPQLWAPKPVLEHWKKLRRQQAEEALSAATKAQ